LGAGRDRALKRAVFYDPGQRDRDALPHDPFKALVAPRPIGWISTLGARGEVNLAPYSFFNAVGEDPPMLAFSSTGLKDSARFAAERGEFVWNLATWELRHQVNATSGTVAPHVDEFELGGLTPAPCVRVAPPRVQESPCSLECHVVHQVALCDVDGAPANQHLVVGQVVGVHLDERYVTDGRVDTAALRPIARCGYRGDYTVVDGLFEMLRPD
jgi:flavin reductase (DIM6/NTAB) family NADH-FMN oxidoreductase RutF